MSRDFGSRNNKRITKAHLLRNGKSAQREDYNSSILGSAPPTLSGTKATYIIYKQKKHSLSFRSTKFINSFITSFSKAIQRQPYTGIFSKNLTHRAKKKTSNIFLLDHRNKQYCLYFRPPSSVRNSKCRLKAVRRNQQSSDKTSWTNCPSLSRPMHCSPLTTICKDIALS